MRNVLVAALLALFPAPALADPSVDGTVTQFVGGDTFWIGRTKIRLCGIDAPERGESGHREATGYIAQIVGRHVVHCVPIGSGTPCDGRSRKRSRGRLVMQCFVEGKDIAGAMVDAGHARDWPKFSGGYYKQ